MTQYELGLHTDIPVKAWLPKEEIESLAFDQIKAVANHPEATGHVAIMPDTHVGFGVPIGCAFLTQGSVIPNAVGVDIGCGVTAVDTGVLIDRQRMGSDYWNEWANRVRREIPVGTARRQKPLPLGSLDTPLRAGAIDDARDHNAPAQLGTLGGGNHFLEAQVDGQGFIWLMVHSGSRRTGLDIAKHYHELAKIESKKRGLNVHEDLASLSLHDEDGRAYLEDMDWAGRFAERSRRIMIQSMLDILLDVEMPETTTGPVIDTPHNFAWIGGDDLTTLHRKGATLALDGELACIPGTMGGPSFIVRGKGNPESHSSSSHGAGRTRGRRAAKRELTVEQFEESLRGTFTKADARELDESPMAYKDPEVVIGRQDDLVTIVKRLQPIITVKGAGRDD